MSKRRLSVPLPPAWFVFNVAVILLAAGLVLGDRQYWHWYTVDPAAIAAIRVEHVQLGDDMTRVQRDMSATQDEADRATRAAVKYDALAAKVDRAAMLTAAAWAGTIGTRQNMSVAAITALDTRCQAWLDKGGDFGAACQ